jgi:thimet oligopeptidase
MYAAFGHLVGYGPAYYGYMYTKVYAADVFAQIKKEGLLNPNVGTRYRREILEKGGSRDPNELLVNFLGRLPNQDAFMCDLGLKTD